MHGSWVRYLAPLGVLGVLGFITAKAGFYGFFGFRGFLAYCGPKEVLSMRTSIAPSETPSSRPRSFSS